MKRNLVSMLGAALLAAVLAPLPAAAQKAEVLWLGQASVRITSTTGKVIMIDPFLRKNPKTPKKWKDLKALGGIDVILITHGHFDHTADVGALAKLTGAKVVGSGALVGQLVGFGVIPRKQAISMNKGGTIMPMGPGVKISMVPAEHSSSLRLPDPTTKKPRLVYAGAPVGYVVKLENGFTIYHSGDTGVFGDMALIHALYKPDLALVSIGGHFTMDPGGAAFALTKLLRPKIVIPIHYGTFPPLKGTPAELAKALGGAPIKMMAIAPGQAVKF
ncbi:MAG: metal-dependent hydrolase [Alphaproteobacteria bacterium]